MRITAPVWLVAALMCACGRDEMHLVSKIEQRASLEVRAPFERLRGGCEQTFRDRFCAGEYEVIGVIDVSAGEDRVLAISDAVGGDRCTNVLWLRLVRLDEVGPVEDPGTLFQLPSDAEIESGPGALHTVAFPQGTVRLDEVGEADANQARAPLTCEEAQRAPR
jgi:hypothetical protein